MKLAQTAIITSFVYKFPENAMKTVKSPDIMASPQKIIEGYKK